MSVKKRIENHVVQVPQSVSVGTLLNKVWSKYVICVCMTLQSPQSCRCKIRIISSSIKQIPSFMERVLNLTTL